MTSPLQDATRLFRLAVDNARDAIFIDDVDGRLVYANEAFFSLYGFDRDTPLAEIRLEDYVHEDDRAALRERHNRRIRGDEVPEMFSYRGIRSDGKVLSLEVHVTHVEHDGQIVGTHSVVRDITERLLMEEHVRQAQKMESIGRLAAGIAHDFNNILQAILGHATLAKEALVTGATDADDTVTDYLDVIMSSSGRAREVIRQLLGFARQGRYRPDLVDINQIVRDALGLLEPGLRSTTRYEIVQDLRAAKAVRGDATQIYQIVQNLALNARDAMPDGGTITFRTSDARCSTHNGHVETVPSGSYVILQVSDTGSGVSAAVREQMFEPFFTTRKGKNTGLGLSTVFGIVKRHGGYIEVDSEPGNGATFSIYLPIAGAQEAAAPAPARPAPAPRRGQRILVVDDEPLLLNMASIHLTRKGYDVATACDGMEALRLFKDGGFALVLVDLIMPPMDGPELFQAIRALDPNARVGIMSGYYRDSTVQDLLESGAVGFVQKPFRLNELSDQIASWLAD